MTPIFTHNALLTSQLQACVNFYSDYCGMRLVKCREGDGPGQRVAWLAPKAGSSPIYVFIEVKRRPPLDDKSDPVLRHFGFDLGDRESVDAHYERMVANGLDAAEPRDWGPIAGYLFFTRDPDGRVVEFSAGQDVSENNWDESPTL